MNWDQAIEGAKSLGFPAIVTFLLIWKVDKWAGILVAELRAFRVSIEGSAESLQKHVTERSTHVIREVTHDVRAAIGPLLPPRVP